VSDPTSAGYVPGQSAPALATVAPGDAYVYDASGADGGAGGSIQTTAAPGSTDSKPPVLPLLLLVAAVIFGS
jgi:hypothetical protein